MSRSKRGRTVTVHLESQRLTEAERWLRESRSFWSRRLSSLADLFDEDEGQPWAPPARSR